METLLPIVVQVVTGILGAQAVGAALKQVAMSQLPKIISGGLGGVGGAAILGNLLGDPATAGVLGGLLGDAIGGAAGGGALTAIIGAVLGAMNKR